MLVVAKNLPPRYLDRQAAVGTQPSRVQPIAWLPDEFEHELLRRRNPIAVEAVERGVWLVGSPPP